MRRGSLAIALFMVVGLATTVGADEVQLDIHDAFNWDAVGTQGEIDYCWHRWDGNYRIQTIMGDHFVESTYCCYAAFPEDGIAGIYEIGKGIVGPRYGPATWETGDPELDVTPNSVMAYAWDSTSTATVPLTEEQQAEYTAINLLFTGRRDGTTCNYSASVRARYVGDATWYVLWNETNTGGATAGGSFSSAGVGGKGGATYGTDVAMWTLGHTAPKYLKNGGSGANSYSTIATGSRYLWTFTTPLSLDPTRVLEAIQIETHSSTGKSNAVWLFAATAYPAGAAGGVDADQSTVEATPDLIPNDSATASTITVVCKDADQNRVSGLEEDDFYVLVTGAGNNPVVFVGEGESGVYTFTMTSDTPGDKTISVTADTVAITMQPTVTVYDASKPTQGTVDALPDAIPDDGQYSSILTIELANAAGTPMSGYAGDVTVEQSAGIGTATRSTVTEPDPTGNPGVYEVEVTGTGFGDVELTVYVYRGEADEATIGDPATITVFTPGVNDYPLADAGDDVTVEDADGDSKEEITLDALGSYDDSGITNYLWQEGTRTVYSGPDAVVLVDMLLGVHDLTLTVSDAASNSHTDFATISVLPPVDDDSVQLDISGAYNFDGFISGAESAHAQQYDPRGEWGLVRRQVPNHVFGENQSMGNVARCIVWEGQAGYAVGIPASGLIHTTYGTYELSTELDSGDFPKACLMTTDDAPYPAPPPDEEQQIWDCPKGRLLMPDNVTFAWSQAVSIALPGDQQKAYEDVNFIFEGTDGKVSIYANYAGEGEGTDGTLIWEAPVLDLGEPPVPTQTGIPTLLGASSNPDIVSALLTDNTWGVTGDCSTIRIDDGNLWTFASGLALNPGKTLVGITVDVVSGAGVTIYAASAHESSGVPLEILAEVPAEEEWVYQNTPATTLDRHVSIATITLVSEATPGEVYDISIADDGPPGANFTLGDVTDNRLVDDTMTVEILGGRVGASTIGAGGEATAYNVTITLQGLASGKSDSAQVQVSLLRIGDINRDGSLTGSDRQLFNQRLNNVATGYLDRTFDLDGSGGAPTGTDKQVMNQALNNVPLP